MQQHPDFDCRRGKQSSRAAPYGTRRTSSQLDMASSQSSHSHSLHEKNRGHGSAKVPATDNGLASWVTDDTKKTFNTIFRKHGSLKERRDLNIKYHHVVCQQCITKNQPCKIRPTALQCGNCPPYIKCTRVPTLKKLRVLDMMDISEEQYDWLLTWYKKTAEEELLEPLKESLKLTSTSLVPLNESHSHETENSTDTQFHKIGDCTDYRTVNVLATNDVTYGYSFPREYSLASITPISTQPSPASCSQNQQLPQDRFFTPAVPYYTPSLLYPPPSPRQLAPTALYRTPDSFHQGSNEDSCSTSAQSSVNPIQYTTVTWSCHDPRAYPTMSEPTQSSISYDERAPYMTNRQTCVDAEFEFGGCDRVSKSAPESLHYPTYPAHGAGCIRYSSSGDMLPGSDKGLLEGSTPSPQFRS
ncbi:uncharacterized protein C8R40DRAFT_1171832 [Lentinula edodes]|uniref:uncharacterized protein n=1 Tax=Lentinula edodes TaxID=5353 RepID=UPI001E8D7BB7|nr:uncharacterized protein C8R40DRAFT_1171832 [Lentinula edodes]KAH7873910.1 hypothetical protein C8R40DRAFT_1171832 [Lentinula edodes]KAJ3911848.1 hypothetical protein F5877DRAFT_85483 [Lentinula edodes]